MHLPQKGGCLCGAMRYEITVAPMAVYACHCRDCQRITGSAFSMALVVPAAAFHLSGPEPRIIESPTDSGRIKTRWLCPECASWVVSVSKPDNGVRRVRCGTLDDPSWPTPTMHCWTRSKQPWLTLPDTALLFETQPPG